MMGEEFFYLNMLPAVPESLMRGLLMIQTQEGFVSEAAIAVLCSRFKRSKADVEAILNFYPQFKHVRPGRVRIAVCRGSACHAKKSAEILSWIGEITAGQKEFSVEETDCLGACRMAPAVSINGKVYGNLDKSRLSRILNEYKNKEIK